MPGRFEPTELVDDETGVWSFDEQPAYRVLGLLIDGALSGQLRVDTDNGSNFLFFREGRAVGVELCEVCAPLGQILLERGLIDSAGFVRAQRQIELEGRLPGQVYVELKLIDTLQLKQALAEQAHRKARRFLASCHGTFHFRRGPAALDGFTASPLDHDLLLLLALELHFEDEAREAYLASFVNQQLRAPDAAHLALDTLGFGHAEQRFLTRLADWQHVGELDRFGTLTRGQMALLLRFLDLRHLLQLRPAPEVLPLEELPDELGQFDISDGDTKPVAELPAAAPIGHPGLRPEKTERVSIPISGWKDPRPARVEKTEQIALPSVMVDFTKLKGDEDDET